MSELTGRKVFGMFAGGFGLIIAVNVYMATKAVSTFPGIVVENSYVASQTFDAELAAQVALGWKVTAAIEDGRVVIGVTGPDGKPVVPASVTARIGRATEEVDDHDLEFAYGNGVLTAEAPAGKGYWVIWLEMTAADGTQFRQRREVVVR
jgi:nitrogen fixation protein FixH